MKNRLTAVAIDDYTDLRHYVTGLLRDGLGIGLETFSGLWSGNERRQAPRMPCDTPCVMDLGYREPPLFRVQLLSLSTTGCLLRVPASIEPSEHIHEIGEICLSLDDGESLKLFGTIVRVEAERAPRDADSLLVGFSFTALDEKNRDRLSRHIDSCTGKSGARPALAGETSV